MQFETSAQSQCYEKVIRWMDELFEDIPWETLDCPGVGLFMGSAWVEVRIFPWDEDDATINVRSTVVTEANLTLELQNFLLRTNTDLQFGAFSIDGDGNILFGHTIVGSTCDPDELEASVMAVLQTADEYDDEIVMRWGGQRALDRSP